ncbi:branched-chain amino acid ABC transporter permease [Streptomyces sp. GQFP]|uniref:branched-chain amino acid ABC transporter permease n=1 Tax=Streptomyces sp. GQFP TaxID=2907545 RepID=UPI001F47049C|nr:ABC transporter permease [Streptomyces sp. GQFP]UIX29265.1 ABC transporter permease [Streptomyces sp. GQFP]
MLQYVIAGLVLGGIYAISAASLTATHRSAGIFNFSFGAMAYFVARFYYYLHTQHGWNIGGAAAVSLLVVAPALGVVLYLALFRFLRQASALIKVVATLGLSVCIPPIATVLFGNVAVLKAPGLAPEPVRVFHPFGVPVTMDQVIVYGCVALLGAAGAVILRYSDIGLRVRAMVDSPAMTSLTGTSPNTVSLGVWALSSFLAGLAGVLSAPIVGLDPDAFTLLMAAAFAAVIAGRLSNLPVAVVVGLGMGVAGSLVQSYLPSDSSFTAAVLPSIPFAVTAAFLTYTTLRRGRLNESDGVGGALDRAITPQGGPLRVSPRKTTPTTTPTPRRAVTSYRWAWEPSTLVLVAVAAVLPYVIDPFWTNYLAQGAAFAVIFLSYTLVTGEGGMIWLCQITFAGVGAVTTAQLATNHGWPVLLAVVAGGALAAPMGLLLGLLTIRLGPLYVALVTLTFGLLMDKLVFTRELFAQRGLGVSVEPPDFAATDSALTLLGLAVFLAVAYFIVNLRRSTTGLALNAVRWSEPGAKTIGVSVVQMKVLVAALAAAIAGIGGGLLAVAGAGAVPADYATLGGVVLLATLVTAGIGSNAGALLAGVTYTLFPAALQVYLPDTYSPVPVILFGLGAVYIARNPTGWIPEIGEQLSGLSQRLLSLRRSAEPGTDPRMGEGTDPGSRPETLDHPLSESSRA